MHIVMSNTFVTYRRVDGKPIFGEYAFVTLYDGCEEEECDMIEEHWVLESRKVIPHVDSWAEFEDDEPLIEAVPRKSDWQ